MDMFKIRRGLSSVIFSEPGIVNPLLVIEDGCWYLCSDTAELFLGVVYEDGSSDLKKINTLSIDEAITAVKQEIEQLKSTALYQSITCEADLPSDFSDPDFNPNITYYIDLGIGTDGRRYARTFIFNQAAQGYLCTANSDIANLEGIVNGAVSKALDENIDQKLAIKVPIAVAETVSTKELYGGNAFS